MLTREELASIREQWAAGGVHAVVDGFTLLDFAEQMLPVRDALLRKAAADESIKAGWAPGRGRESLAAIVELDKLARELAETDTEVEP